MSLMFQNCVREQTLRTGKIDVSTQSSRDGNETLTQRGESIERVTKYTVCTDGKCDKEKGKYENHNIQALKSMSKRLDNDADISKKRWEWQDSKCQQHDVHDEKNSKLVVSLELDWKLCGIAWGRKIWQYTLYCVLVRIIAVHRNNHTHRNNGQNGDDGVVDQLKQTSKSPNHLKHTRIEYT